MTESTRLSIATHHAGHQTIPSQMKVLVKRSEAPGDLSLEKQPVPSCGPNQILVKVIYAGICGSDLDIIDNKTDIYQPPVVLGHETLGEVIKTGENVSGFSIGDRVVSETALDVCDQCQPCQNGYFEICDNKKIIGWTSAGCFAEYAVLNSRFAHKLDSTIDAKAAALTEPIAIAVEALYVRGKIQPNESVAVVGPGSSGILCALVAKQLGAKKVFLIGRKSFSEMKLPLVKELGIEHAIDSSQVVPQEYLLKHNRDHFADVVVDATGTIEGFNTATELLKRHGRLLKVGSITTPTMFDWPKMARKATNLIFPFASGRKAWLKTLDILQEGKMDFGRLVTHTFILESYSEAFRLAADGSKSIKVLLEPKGIVNVQQKYSGRLSHSARNV